MPIFSSCFYRLSRSDKPTTYGSVAVKALYPSSFFTDGTSDPGLGVLLASFIALV